MIIFQVYVTFVVFSNVFLQLIDRPEPKVQSLIKRPVLQSSQILHEQIKSDLAPRLFEKSERQPI